MNNLESQSGFPANTNSQNPNYFKFEADFVGSLQCIPMQVRMKLDNCGVKLKLVHWNQFDQSERQTLVDMPCASSSETKVFKEFLQDLVIAKTSQPAKELTIDPHPAWLNGSSIPETVAAKAKECQVDFALKNWSELSPAQRFALIKLSRPSHENKNFLPALQEFGVVSI